MHVHTPLLRSTQISQLRQMDVWLKMESSQPSGSFKMRGIGRAAQRAVANGACRLVSSSGGNAGLAVAHAGRILRVPVLVVVPRRTPVNMQHRIADQGAQVLVYGEVWDDAHRRAMVEAESGGTLIHPFDHPDIWEGHATMIDEVALAIDRPGSVVVSVGGGGLLVGVLQGLEAAGWADVPVLAVETHGSASLGAAMAAGRPTRLDEIRTVALSLGAKQVADEALRLALIRDVTPVQVS
ncbi:MAG: pyridoxal-phosphate dependent enzyme, partial [Rhodobacterales bacterium]|nr:pyridoxal-phosphate dependent enzyme [Rhodobacterales bacterium]